MKLSFDGFRNGKQDGDSACVRAEVVLKFHQIATAAGRDFVLAVA